MADKTTVNLHSPGEWYVWGWDDPEGTPLRVLTHVGARRTLATVHPHDTEVERDANARLIAAAPQLLTALTASRFALLSYRGGNTSTDLADEIIQAIDAAIAKTRPPED